MTDNWTIPRIQAIAPRLMANELIVNVTVGETRIARLENGVVAELYIERARETGILGNVYKGKVVRVLPGMQAAFVEIGLAKTGFLHVSDALPASALAGIEMPSPMMDDDDEQGDDDDNGDASDLAAGCADGEELSDPVDAPDGATIEEGGDATTTAATQRPLRGRRRMHHSQVQIQDIVKEGQEILVQVIKEPISTKGARITSHVSLPGRHLVFMPNVDQIGVSRRIEDERERRRLRDIIMKHKPKGSGFIVRTASAGVSDQDLIADIEYLMRTGAETEARATTAKAPSLVHAELDVVRRVVRDLFTDDIDRLVIDSESEHQRVREFVATFMPRLKDQIICYTDNEPIFDHFAIEVEINRALGQKVWLKSGGYIIVEQTEALTAIDVNTGRYVGRRSVEDTILKTNLEAVREIVYQLRLRNIGGIIILDFIDMDRQANRTKVYNALKEALKADRAKTNISKISELGLVEMTRKRTREDLRRLLGDPCPYCEGKGFLKSPSTICFEIFREILREARHMKGRQIMVLAHPSISNVLYDEERPALEEIESRVGGRVQIRAHPEFHLEQFEIIEASRA